MKKFKKLFLVIAAVLTVTLLSGCSKNGSPEDVAKAMVKQLSDKNYSNMDKLFYHEGYFTDAAFQRQIVYEDLDISGNNTIKVKETSEPYEDEDGYNSVDVSISIDGSRIFKLHTIEVEGKWYVYDDSFIGTKDIKVIVPKGSTLEIDGEKVDDDYLAADGEKITYSHPSSSSSIVQVPAVADVYVLPKTIKGGFAVKVTNGSKVIDDAIGYNSADLDIAKGEYDYSSTDTAIIYDFYSSSVSSSTDNEKLITASVKDFITTLYSNINDKKDFTTLSSYFDTGYQLIAKGIYNDTLDILYTTDEDITDTYDYKYYNFSVSSFSVKDIKEYDSNNIAVSIYYRLDYKYKYKRSSYSDTITDSSDYNYVYDVLLLSKTDSTYIIKDAYKLVGRSS